MNNNTQDGSKLTPKVSEIFYEASLGEHGFIIHTEKAIEIHNQQTAALQARVNELEAEVGRLQKDRNFYVIQFGDSQQYAKKLTGLLENEVKMGLSEGTGSDRWEVYKKEYAINEIE